MQRPAISFFEGMPESEIAEITALLDRREIGAGTVVLAEGDVPHQILVIESGTADISAMDVRGTTHGIAQVGPGTTMGEMSVLTGQAASATVRAATDLSVRAMSETDFHRIASSHPRLYRNLATMLSQRLAFANRKLVSERGKVTVLEDDGAPPLLGYALACSIAWHTCKPVLLLVLSDGGVSPELAALAEKHASPAVAGAKEPRAHILIAPPSGKFGPEEIASAFETLVYDYGHTLVQLARSVHRFEIEAPRVRLASASTAGASPDETPDLVCGWVEGATGRFDAHGVLRVPQLTTPDSDHLEAGTLPAHSPAGRALGASARKIAEMRVGIALGAGSTKGYAHIGVLRVLEGAGVPVDFLAGTSVGAAVSGLYALGHDLDTISRQFDAFSSKAIRLGVPVNGLLSNSGVRAFLRSVGGECRIEDLPIPLAISTADILTGKEVVFRRGLLWVAALASISIPGIFPPVRVGPHMLVDGGVVNPVPSSLVSDMGADAVIAVKLGGMPTSEQTEGVASSWGNSDRLPIFPNTMLRAFDIMQRKISVHTAAVATVQITVAMETATGLRNFGAAHGLIAAGEDFAREALPRISATLPWVGSQ